MRSLLDKVAPPMRTASPISAPAATAAGFREARSTSRGYRLIRRVVLQMRRVRFHGSYAGRHVAWSDRAVRSIPGAVRDFARRRPALLPLATAALIAAMIAPATAAAAPQAWNGRYQMVTYASQKAGTSPASRQPEIDFGAVFTLATQCSGNRCVATVIDGPRPGNPTIPQPARYTWNGAEWTSTYEWLWDCLLEDGNQKQWARATSWAYYKPQSDGSLRGTWHTDISEGACRGTVVMPVAGAPA